MPRTLLPPRPAQLAQLAPSPTAEPEHAVWLTAPASAVAAPVPSPASRVSSTKRRASSLGDLFQRPPTSSSPAKALVRALHSVSTRTHQKLATFRSQSDHVLASGGWLTKVNNPIRRAAPVKAHSFQREPLQHASAAFEFHAEDAGAAASYFHVVADGVSSPFGRQSLAEVEAPVSSAVLSAEVVRCVRAMLEELTNHNREPLDQQAFESAVVDAVKTARINCFQHRKSRLATTLAVSYFNRWTGKLLTFSLGDSKCLVVRNGKVVYETLAVLREFNVPTVVNLREQVVPKDYVVQSFGLQEGDVCLTFSDGLGDNVYKDDITAALAAPELWETEGTGLQSVCDQLVNMSKVHENIQDGIVSERRLYPFATAAVLEYRERTLEETKLAAGAPVDASGVDHMEVSRELMERHKGKKTLDRHLMLRRPSRKHHYSLMQLKLMAEMQTKKPDDITLFMTRFV
ncbi:protein phosphatase 2C BIPP2C1 [Phytophthora cinnamomi]|uniref:protein phosphatase 2C BIPP2C1 n=1 Tax=Phytophthora cinnamomi TaxID=4785 RepID=UPI00355AC36B|nr:protein phosphatase 2C BIPP2C1 [Phytophthora cinnamomi]